MPTPPTVNHITIAASSVGCVAVDSDEVEVVLGVGGVEQVQLHVVELEGMLDDVVDEHVPQLQQVVVVVVTIGAVTLT